MTAETLNQIVDYIYSDTFFSGYCHSMYKNDYSLGQEIFQEYLLGICEKPIEKVLEIYNKGYFNYYSANMIFNISYMKSGMITKQFVDWGKRKISFFEDGNDDLLNEDYSIENGNKQLMVVDEEFVPDRNKSKKLIERLKAYLKEREEKDSWFFYDKKLFEMYFFDKKTYRQISKETDIPHTSIYLTISNLKKEIKSVFGKEYEHIFTKS